MALVLHQRQYAAQQHRQLRSHLHAAAAAATTAAAAHSARAELMPHPHDKRHRAPARATLGAAHAAGRAARWPARRAAARRAAARRTAARHAALDGGWRGRGVGVCSRLQGGFGFGFGFRFGLGRG